MSDPPSHRLATRAASPTSLVIGINVAAYLAMVLVGGRSDFLALSSNTLVLFGADYAPLVREGQLHRLLAAAFLHLNPLHLLLNTASLALLGPMVERDYGRLRFVVIYLGSGIVGSIASVAWHYRHPVVSAGASGALMGLLAAGAVRAHFAGEERARERGALVLGAVVTLVVGALIQTNNAAHLGGLVAGVAFALLFRRAKSVDGSATLPSAILIGAVVAVFGMSIAVRSRAATASELVNRGVDLAHADDHEAAIAAYRRAIALEPNDSIAHYDLGLSLTRVGQFEAALGELRRAFELDPSPAHRDALVNAHRRYAGSLLEKADAVAAVRELRSALEIAPGDEIKRELATALIQEGSQYVKSEKRPEAIARFREAIALNERSWVAHYDLGVVLLSDGDTNGAVAALEKAHSLQPSEDTRSALADAIEARGDAHADAGALGAALDDMGASTILRLAPIDGGGGSP